MEQWTASHITPVLASRLKMWRAPSHLCLVADDNTMRAAGTAVYEALQSDFEIQQMNVGDSPRATVAQAEAIIRQATSGGAIMSVGSGTLTDLCKYASHHLRIPHIAYATAPSMNGYGSATASLHDGVAKRSLPAARPNWLIADIEVLAAAPQRLIRAGLGDVMCRSTCQADWHLAHLLLGTASPAPLYKAWQVQEQKMLSLAADLPGCSPQAIACLMELLMISAEAMYLAHSSAPASQGEHMIAHYCEMLHEEKGLPQESYHGEQIAITTLTMSALQDKWLRRATLPAISPALYDGVAPAAFAALLQDKQAQVSAVQKHLCHASAQWPQMATTLMQRRLSTSQLRAVLESANCPTHPQQIGWQPDIYAKAVDMAFATRDRFTFLDIEAAEKRV